MQRLNPFISPRFILKYLKYNSYSTQYHSFNLLSNHITNYKIKCDNRNFRLGLYSPLSKSVPETFSVDRTTFERVCEETLESLTEYFEQLVEDSSSLDAADVSYSSGVLTVNLGSKYGTYVINRQSPNRQIWLSSPISGPKRYDFMAKDNCWIYKHDGLSLHQLLQKEIAGIVTISVDFSKCSHSKL